MKKYELVICGGGPAGVTAGIYAKRYNLNVLIITKTIGGLLNEMHDIENYPGFSRITGAELAVKFEEHLKALEVPVMHAEIIKIEKTQEGFLIKTTSEEVKAKAIIIAFGTSKRKLGIPGEEEFKGKGVSYCATCDAAFFKGKTVAVVGGNDSAAEAALLLTEHAEKVFVIYRGKKLRATPILTEKVYSNPKIKVIHETVITEILGKDFVEKIKLSNGEELEVQGVFIEAGSLPSTEPVAELEIKTDESGAIITDEWMKTNIPGAFAAGDVRKGLLRQVITAAADGAIAATSAFKYLRT